MRRFLYSVGCLFATFALIGLLIAAASGLVVADVAGAVLLLAIGVLLSAPFELAPPEDRDAVVLFVLPGWVLMVGIVLRALVWVGDKVLAGVWTLAFAVWDRRAERVAANRAL